MAKRDPHDVLGVTPGASATTIKAAWRRLARANHPDLTGDDPAASQRATRRMAEINDAYEALRHAAALREGGVDGEPDGRGTGAPIDPAGRRAGGPPRARPTRPVTARVDTSRTFRPRNTTIGQPVRLTGQAPLRPAERLTREPPRASDPTGPLERARIHRFRAPERPTLEAAREIGLEFGKFRGHTLGEVAAFEPSYIDWLARTITGDPDLVGAARVLQEELDRRGIARRHRPEPATRSTDRSA